MTPHQLDRWQKLENFAFDAPNATATFESRVVGESGWTRATARRAIAEYRRFLLLAAEAGHPVSPSPAVDVVWHAHLLYTRNYWDALCRDVLGRPLHHEPATGDSADAAKLDDWYARTLASYAAIFGEPPPADVWPAHPAHRSFVRIDPGRSVVLSRGLWRILVALLVLSAAIAAGSMLILGLSTRG